TVSKPRDVPVGLAQIAQGSAGPLIARALGEGSGVHVAAGLAAVIAHNWSPWLRFTGGRGIGPAIGVLLVISPVALAVFVVLAFIGVALKAVPQLMALGLVLSPAAAAAARQPAPVIAGCAALALIVLLKRVFANGPPEPPDARPGVLRNRLIFDRDIPDREAWVHRRVTSRSTRRT